MIVPAVILDPLVQLSAHTRVPILSNGAAEELQTGDSVGYIRAASQRVAGCGAGKRHQEELRIGCNLPVPS